MATNMLPRVTAVFRQKIEYRLRREGLSRREAKESVEEMLAFLASPVGAPNKEADAAWHAAVLHTPEYREFCEDNFGDFIEHVPVWPPQKADCTAVACGSNCGKCGCSRKHAAA